MRGGILLDDDQALQVKIHTSGIFVLVCLAQKGKAVFFLKIDYEWFIVGINRHETAPGSIVMKEEFLGHVDQQGTNVLILKRCLNSEPRYFDGRKEGVLLFPG